MSIVDLHDITESDLEIFFRFTYEYTIVNSTGFSKRDLASMFEWNGRTISEEVCYALCQEYGFVWTDKDQVYGDPNTPERRQSMTHVLLEYSQARQLELKGEAVICSQDESWANEGTNNTMSWVHR